MKCTPKVLCLTFGVHFIPAEGIIVSKEKRVGSVPGKQIGKS